MKRSISFLLCIAFLILLSGCGTNTPSGISIAEGQNSASETAEEIDSTLPSDNLVEQSSLKQERKENIQICIRIGETMLYADMYDRELAKEFVSQLPQTISMQRVGGGREFYGSLESSLDYDEADSQTTFQNGEIAYWYSGNGLCLLYNNQVDEPEINSGIIVLGKITSDFSILNDLEDRVEVTVTQKRDK